MASFTLLDLLAFAWFLGAWIGYSLRDREIAPRAAAASTP